MDTFTQSIFNYISTKEEESIKNDQKLEEEDKRRELELRAQQERMKPASKETQERQEMQENHDQEHQEQEHQEQRNPEHEITYSNQVQADSNDTEQEKYNINQPINQFEDKLTENFESKEILSEMVSQLKETLIQENKESLQQDLEYVSELKEELHSNKEESKPENLYDLLNTTFTVSDQGKDKKKEEELMNMKMADLKELAKKKNIRVLDQSKKPKKKETLVMELLNQS
jgi:hypothetical protein